jgi:hypothetical protein
LSDGGIQIVAGKIFFGFIGSIEGHVANEVGGKAGLQGIFGGGQEACIDAAGSFNSGIGPEGRMTEQDTAADVDEIDGFGDGGVGCFLGIALKAAAERKDKGEEVFWGGQQIFFKNNMGRCDLFVNAIRGCLFR